MTALLICIGYVLVWLVYGWRLSIYLIDKEQRRIVELYGERMLTELPADRGGLMVAGFSVAVLWPVTLPGRAIFRLLSGHGLMTTPTEKAMAERAELAKLRTQAREYGLPMGDEK